MSTTKPKRRCLNGVWFECLSPGSWLSESKTVAIVHMLAGTSQAQWELYLTQLGKGLVRWVPTGDKLDTADFLCCDHWASGFTFGELAKDAAKLCDWARNLSRGLIQAAEKQDQWKKWGFGPDANDVDQFGSARSPLLKR